MVGLNRHIFTRTIAGSTAKYEGSEGCRLTFDSKGRFMIDDGDVLTAGITTENGNHAVGYMFGKSLADGQTDLDIVFTNGDSNEPMRWDLSKLGGIGVVNVSVTFNNVPDDAIIGLAE